MSDWYDTPLYYDIIFDQDTGLEADFLEKMMQRHAGIRPSHQAWRILEPACGSGRLITELAGRGHDVSGFDLNPHMLEHARRKVQRTGRQALLWQDRMESFKLPFRLRYDLAHCLVSTFKYLLDEKSAISHLHQVSKALRSGGLYVLGLHLTDYEDGGAAHERWVGRRNGTQVICNTHTWPPDRRKRTEDVRTRLRITRRGQSKTLETRWQFRTYNAAQIKALLARINSFELAACHDFTYDPQHQRRLDDSYADVVLILRKR